MKTIVNYFEILTDRSSASMISQDMCEHLANDSFGSYKMLYDFYIRSNCLENVKNSYNIIKANYHWLLNILNFIIKIIINKLISTKRIRKYFHRLKLIDKELIELARIKDEWEHNFNEKYTKDELVERLEVRNIHNISYLFETH